MRPLTASVRTSFHNAMPYHTMLQLFGITQERDPVHHPDGREPLKFFPANPRGPREFFLRWICGCRPVVFVGRPAHHNAAHATGQRRSSFPGASGDRLVPHPLVQGLGNLSADNVRIRVQVDGIAAPAVLGNPLHGRHQQLGVAPAPAGIAHQQVGDPSLQGSVQGRVPGQGGPEPLGERQGRGIPVRIGGLQAELDHSDHARRRR
mmetsp:Transcript_22402/g.48754  ORF Transcript_22402/g.48754 Transcript_22402/m.48754 type:complete len:206 (+) Transcript_22402:288-905(+)